MFVLFHALFATAAIGLDAVLGTTIGGSGYGYFYPLFSLIVLIPTISASVRRLHDINKSGWHLLLVFIPVAGAIWLLVMLATEGTEGANHYGYVVRRTRVFAY